MKPQRRLITHADVSARVVVNAHKSYSYRVSYTRNKTGMVRFPGRGTGFARSVRVHGDLDYARKAALILPPSLLFSSFII